MRYRLVSSYFILSLILFSCSNNGLNNFDSQFSLYSYLDHELADDFIKPIIEQQEINLSEVYLRNVNYSDINLIFDVSAGLVDGFNAAENTVIKPLYEAFERKKLYKSGFERDESCVLYDGSIDYFRQQSSYNFPYSYIKGGLLRATENKNEISVFFTDYLYDDGSMSYPANNKINTSNILTRGWELSAFKDWFSNGGRVHIQVIPYYHEKWKKETNYYAIYFVPRESDFEKNPRIERIFNEVTTISIDPLLINVNTSEFSQYIDNSKSIYEGEEKWFDINNDFSYGYLGLRYVESVNIDLSKLGRISIENNSIWKLDLSIEVDNTTSLFRDSLESKLIGWNEDDSKFCFTEWQYPTGQVIFNNNKNSGFNESPYITRPDLFVCTHELKVNSISNNILEKNYRRSLVSEVKPDNQNQFFLNEALFIDIDQGIENSRSSVLKLLQEKPLFRLYTFTSVGPN